MEYLLIKWIHILSSTILFGTGIGSAFYMFVANRTKDISSINFATRWVVIADWVFTAPTAIIQFITGLILLHITGYSFSDMWVIFSLALYLFVVVWWLIVVWIQIKMRNLAKASFNTGKALQSKYWKMDRWWIILGSLAFPAMIAIFYLMVVKP